MSDISNTLPSAFGNPAQKMTSSEIADLVESRHDKVRQSIDRLVERGIIVQPPMGDEPGTDAMGRPRVTKVYVFVGEQGKRDSIIVVAQLCPEFTAKLVDRWAELEKVIADPRRALSDPSTLRHLLLENVEARLALESRVAEMEPEVAAYERIAVADGSLCFRDAAKTLQVRPKDLTDFLVAHHWVYTRPGVPGYIAYQSKLQTGLLEHKTTTVHRSDGSEKVVSQCRVTPKGLTRLAKEFPPVARAA